MEGLVSGSLWYIVFSCMEMQATVSRLELLAWLAGFCRGIMTLDLILGQAFKPPL